MLECPRQRVPAWPAPSENTGCQVSSEPPVTCCHSSVLEELNASCGGIKCIRRGLEELVPASHQTSVPGIFPLC